VTRTEIFLGLSLPLLYGVLGCFSLITQRSVVQIHPPQPNFLSFQQHPRTPQPSELTIFRV
jgi:hypothetical protein